MTADDGGGKRRRTTEPPLARAAEKTTVDASAPRPPVRAADEGDERGLRTKIVFSAPW